ncbi:MAG: type II toxin-antitoxin system VapC family toxin [Rectinemataceae bacterium]
MTWVVDAGAAASLFLPDEEGSVLRGILVGLEDGDRLLVPLLWWYEMTTVLVGLIKRGRLEEAAAFHALEMLRRLNPSRDMRPLEESAPAAFVLARAHGLSVYDAAYLELAAREGGTLCSFDGPLRSAAIKAGIPLEPAA